MTLPQILGGVLLGVTLAATGTGNECHVVDESAIWSAQKNSTIGRAVASEREGSWKWTFQSDGTTPYDNSVSTKFGAQDWSDCDFLVFDFYAEDDIAGRLGCQVVSNGQDVGLADVNPATIKGKWQRTHMLPDKNVSLEKGRWHEVSIPISERVLNSVTEVRLFCDGRQFPDGEHHFYFRNFRVRKKAPTFAAGSRNKTEGKPVVPFSSLSPEEQRRIREQTDPPKLSDRRTPYSLFMCYPMWGVKDSEGRPMLGSSPDGKWHPEWQEVLIKDWADLGLTQLHFYAWPRGCGTEVRDYRIDNITKEGIRGFAQLCQKYGIKIGLRVDPPYEMEKRENLPPNQDPTGNFWPAHPRNPDNELEPFWGWVIEILALLNGEVEYVVLGDEIDASRQPRADGRGWTVNDFMEYTKMGAEAIHQRFPNVKVSMPAFGAGSWREVVEMLKLGYGNFADAVAINNDNYRLVKGFKEDLDKYSPNKKLMLISNGVGYVGSNTEFRNPTIDFYRRHNDHDQAGLVARAMYSWWEADADVAPYYVAVRSFISEGKMMPLWYGFFGFMDLDLDEQGGRVAHYPAWSALQTITHTFHDRDAFRPTRVAVESSSEHTLHLKAFERGDGELVIILWGEKIPGETTTIRIASTQYRYPVQVNLGNWREWTDLSAVDTGDAIVIDDVPLGLSPTIIRLLSRESL